MAITCRCVKKLDAFRQEVVKLLLSQGREDEAKDCDAILKDASNYLTESSKLNLNDKVKEE